MGNRPLCVSSRCAARGYHWPDCKDADCRGCQPRLAADGLNLCLPHLEWLPQDARKAGRLYDDLAQALITSSQSGERTSGTPDRGASLNPRAVEARTTIRAVLTSWCRLIAEERGIGLPSRRAVEELPLGFIGPPRIVLVPHDHPAAMGAYLARHADWLAAHPAAGEASEELRELVTLAHPVAYPTGARVFPVGPCLHDCEGTIKAILRRVDSLLPSSLVCDVDDEHTWPADQWLTLGRKLRRTTTEGAAA